MSEAYASTPHLTFLPRLFTAHILVLPGLPLALITAHLMILWHQPWIMNSWLYHSLSITWRPGSSSSARISIAISPAIRNIVKDVERYG